MTKVRIMIPTFNRKSYLKILLEQFLRQEIPGYEVRIIVVDDGSKDGTGEMLQREYPGVRVVSGSGNWWFTRCINEGMRAAVPEDADFILTINDDVEIEDSYLKMILAAAESVARPCIIGSVSYTIEQPRRITFSGIRKVVWWRYKQYDYIKQFTPVEPSSLHGLVPSVGLPARGMLIHRDVIRAIGLWDERLPQYGSDEEYCLRANQRI